MRKHRDQPASTIKATMIAGSNHRQKRSKEKIKVKILSENNCGGTPPAAGSESIRCGQCDKSTASLVSQYWCDDVGCRWTGQCSVLNSRAVLSVWRTTARFATPSFIRRELWPHTMQNLWYPRYG